jgi:1,5-anhydro-D-fructose reductase (1,5-anhydro-D-mannitol-forming)
MSERGDGGGRPLRWGLIGTSQIALRWMAPAIRAAGHELAVVYSRTPARARTYADALQIERAVSALDDVWDAGVDAVYVSSTNDLHAEQTIQAARAGVHVLCEKPLAMTLADAHAMQDECDRHGVVLATNHHMRNLAAHRAVRRSIAAGVIGKPLSAWLTHASQLPEEWHGWRLSDPSVGGGVGLDLAVHDVDLLRFLLGAEVEGVVALSARQGIAAEGVEDALMTVLRFEGEILAFCHDAWNVPNAAPRLVIHGSDAAIDIADHSGPDAVAELVRDGVREPIPTGPRTDPYVEAVTSFASAVAGSGAPSCTGRDGIRSLAAALAALASAKGSVAPAP